MNKPIQKIMSFSIILALLLAPLVLQSNQTLSSKGKSGKTYDWRWTEAPLTSVFDHISAAAGVDIVVDPKLVGTVTIKLSGKTWEEAFEIISNLHNLYYEKKNGYIYVASKNDYMTGLVAESNLKAQLENIVPLEQVIVQLKNTTAPEMIMPVTAILSQRGKVTAVEHTNSLIIKETPDKIAEVQARVSDLDREVLQISISAKLVEVATGTQNDMGIQWSFFDKSAGWEVTHFPTNPIANTLEKVTYGILDPKGFSMALNFLFTEKNSEIVAEPQITTLENKEATIHMGSQIPLPVVDFAGNARVEQIDAESKLTVTPRITGEGRILMHLIPEKKSYEITEDGPIIHTQGAETNVVVQDGETIVIAGMTADERQETEGGIPFLKDIPILGYLFKSSTKKVEKRDLIIFVTPHIIKSSGLEVLKERPQESGTATGSSFSVERPTAK